MSTLGISDETLQIFCVLFERLYGVTFRAHSTSPGRISIRRTPRTSGT